LTRKKCNEIKKGFIKRRIEAKKIKVRIKCKGIQNFRRIDFRKGIKNKHAKLSNK